MKIYTTSEIKDRGDLRLDEKFVKLADAKAELNKLVKAENETCANECECLFINLSNTEDIRDLCAEAIRTRS